ncbi:MAG: DUF4129 domain-containing protein [Myxococcota bacterium]|nr:DUF4129 domain-containing protein [Myxococcota bacterium]
MRLEDLQAELRPRHGFEAMDLGLRMLQRWWKPAMGAWLVTLLASSVLAFGLTFWALPLGLFVLWCTQVLTGRVVLFVLSRALFGALPTLKETLQATPKLLFSDWGGAFVDRLDPTRALVSPVRQLEGLRGSEANRRKSQLRAKGAALAMLLSATCWAMEMLVSVGVVAFVFMVLPETPAFRELLYADLADLSFPGWLRGVFLGAWLIAHALIEPLHVAAGFGLYINRRTRLEGWDVELQFRQLARRLGSRKVLGAALILVCTFLPLSAHADESAFGGIGEVRLLQGDPELGDLTPNEAVHQVLEHPDFDTTETTTTWRKKEGADSKLLEWLEGCTEPQEQEPQQMASPSLEPLSAGIQALLWVGMGALLIFIVVILLRGRGDVLAGALERPLPESRSGTGGPSPELLPSDLPAVARRHWANGEHALAVGLLYQGAVADLVRRGLPIDEGATEGECLRVVRRRLEGETLAYFKQLTRTWQTLAYAHRGVGDAEFEPLVSTWARHFNEGAA